MGVVTALIAGATIAGAATAYSAYESEKAADKQAKATEEAAKLQAETEAQIAENEAQAAREAAANNPTDSTEAEASAVLESERRRIRARKSMGGTVLTSPLGTSGGTATGASSKLGT